MTASVSLIMALGGGWDPSQLPKMHDLLEKQRDWQPGGAPLPKTPSEVAPANPPTVQPIPLNLPAYQLPVQR
jgi:hypothetical protein